MEKSTLLLIDGHNIFIRSFSGLMRHGLSAPNGEGTWGAYGAYNVVTSMIRKYNPSHVLIAFDKGRSTKRLAIDPEYKANRHKPSDKPKTAMDDAFSTEFKPQMATFMNLCLKSGIPFMSLEGVEADDIIATAALKHKEVFDKIVIVSADHDLHQLIRPNIIVVKPSISYKDIDAELYDVEAIKNEWGVEPERLSEIWALMGDKGDNVKGIPGIGPKKAMKLIAEHGDLETVLNLEDEKIQNNIEVVRMAKRLIELDVDNDLPFPPLGDLQFTPVRHGGPNAQALDELFVNLGFTQIRSRWFHNNLWNDVRGFGRSLL
jgi:DNA polymerase-1